MLYGVIHPYYVGIKEMISLDKGLDSEHIDERIDERIDKRICEMGYKH